MSANKNKFKSSLRGLKDYSGIIAILISVLIFFFGSIKDCESTYNQKVNIYNSNAMNFRPFIVLEKPPIINEVFYLIDTSWLDYTSGIHSVKDSNDLPMESVFKGIKVNLKFNVINTGKYPTRIIGVVLADTVSNYPILMNWDKRNLIIEEKSADDFYQSIYLPVKGKHEFTYKEHSIKNTTDSSFTIHFLIIYENDLVNLYFSYFTIEYHFTIREVLLDYNQIKKAQAYPYLRIKVEGDATRIVSPQFDSNFYKYERANYLYGIIYDKSYEIENKLKFPEKFK